MKSTKNNNLEFILRYVSYVAEKIAWPKTSHAPFSYSLVVINIKYLIRFLLLSATTPGFVKVRRKVWLLI